MHAFYLSPELWPESGSGLGSGPESGKDELALEGQEAHHLLRVLRMHPGDELVLLDGQGREARCRIERCTRQSVGLTLLEEVQHPRPESRVILAAGWGKAARRGWILEKAVELEAAALWFWQAERSQFPVPEDIKDNWHTQLVAGAKQCHNPWVPELRTFPGGVQELVEASALLPHKHVLVESEHPHHAFLDDARLALPGDTLCVVGPEGGFSSAEVTALEKAGFEALSMGTRILRWETAALMALGLHWWKRQRVGSAL